jgi:hypothetical protein
MASPRDLWEAWDSNPGSVSGRRIIYWYFTPFGFAGLILMLVVGQWVAAGFMAFFLSMALVSGARSCGTHAQWIVAWLRRRSADA